jgi:hypothetical protein
MPRVLTNGSSIHTYILMLPQISSNIYPVISHIYYNYRYYNVDSKYMLKLKAIRNNGGDAQGDIISQWEEER